MVIERDTSERTSILLTSSRGSTQDVNVIVGIAETGGQGISLEANDDDDLPVSSSANRNQQTGERGRKRRAKEMNDVSVCFVLFFESVLAIAYNVIACMHNCNFIPFLSQEAHREANQRSTRCRPQINILNFFNLAAKPSQSQPASQQLLSLRLCLVLK